MKKFTSIAFLLCTMCAFVLVVSSCQKEKDGAAGNNPRAKKLIMATNAEFPPFEYVDEAGNFQGIDIDIMQSICKELGRELVVENIAFDSIIPAVTSGKADCGVAGMTITEDRLRNVDFSTPYYTAYQVIVVPKGSAILGKADLAGKRIGVQTGTTGDTMAGDIEGVQMNRYSKGAEAILALVQNKVDAVVIDDKPARAFVAKNAEKLVILEEPLSDESYAMAVKKGNNELLAQLNAQIERIKNDGTLDAVRAKYEGSADESAE